MIICVICGLYLIKQQKNSLSHPLLPVRGSLVFWRHHNLPLILKGIFIMQENIQDIPIFITQTRLIGLIELFNHLGILGIRGKEEFNIVHNPGPEILFLSNHVSAMDAIVEQRTLTIDRLAKEITNQAHPSVMPGILGGIGVVEFQCTSIKHHTTALLCRIDHHILLRIVRCLPMKSTQNSHVIIYEQRIRGEQQRRCFPS